MSEVTYTRHRGDAQGRSVDGGGFDGGGVRNGDGRRLERRRTLPGGRAVVGGFLIALAAVGVFAAYTDATADNRQQYLVAEADLPLGHRITRADVGYRAMDLPPDVRSRANRDPSRLVGGIVIGPLAKGDLIHTSDVAGSRGEAGFGPEISVPVESARALSGQLEVGELVDVLATYDAGGQGSTMVVVRNARVTNRSKPGGALSDGANGKEVLTLAVANSGESLAVAHAASAGTITIVRSGGPQSATGPSSYQTPMAGSTSG